MLKRNSWVNIRHIYRVDASLLKPYDNPETPERSVYCFEQQSLTRMLAKCESLVGYEPGLQFTGLEVLENLSEGERGCTWTGIDPMA